MSDKVLLDPDKEDWRQSVMVSSLSIPTQYDEEDTIKQKIKEERKQINRNRENTILYLGETSFDIKIEKKNAKDLEESKFAQEIFKKKSPKKPLAKHRKGTLSMTEFEINQHLNKTPEINQQLNKVLDISPQIIKAPVEKKKKKRFMRSGDSDSDDDGSYTIALPTTPKPTSGIAGFFSRLFGSPEKAQGENGRNGENDFFQTYFQNVKKEGS
jgi:hypothetical protein